MKVMMREIKAYQLKKYLDETKQYLEDVKINRKKSYVQKIQLKKPIKFISFKDTDEDRVMHSNSYNIEIMMYDKAGEVIKKLFESLLSRYQIDLEISMKASDYFS